MGVLRHHKVLRWCGWKKGSGVWCRLRLRVMGMVCLAQAAARCKHHKAGTKTVLMNCIIDVQLNTASSCNFTHPQLAGIYPRRLSSSRHPHQPAHL